MKEVLRKLRMRFILTTTGIVFLLVLVAATGYCLSVASSAKEEVNGALRHAFSDPMLFVQAPDAGAMENRPNSGPGGGGGPDYRDWDQGGVDLFQGKRPLIYLVAVDENQNIVERYSRAIILDDEVLERAIAEIFALEEFTQGEEAVIVGKSQAENLFFKAEWEGDLVYLAFADATSVDEQIQRALTSSAVLSIGILVLTILISIILAHMSLMPVQEAWKKQNRFIADASHELKTPLTVIIANTEIVRSDPQARVQEQMKWLDGTMEESERLQGLIANFLLLASLDDEQSSVEASDKEKVDFSEAVENTIMSFEAPAYEKNIALTSSIEPGVFVHGIKSRIVHLPDLLVDNACKYTEEGGSVSVHLSKQGPRGVLRVINTGSSIPEEELDYLFDRFYRADTARSSETPGYGLGLSIAQRIMHEVGGTISAENLKEQEIAFTAVFPLATSS